MNDEAWIKGMGELVMAYPDGRDLSPERSRAMASSRPGSPNG